MEEKDMVYVFQAAVFILWHWEIKKTWLTKTTWSKTAQAAGASWGWLAPELKRSGLLDFGEEKKKVVWDYHKYWTLSRIQHKNFIGVYEMYLFEDKVFTVIEYIDFTVEDILLRSIRFTDSSMLPLH
jgi:hypothetical protein